MPRSPENFESFFEIAADVGIWPVECSSARDNDVIVIGFGDARRNFADRGLQTPPDAVACHRVAELLRHRKAETGAVDGLGRVPAPPPALDQA